MIFREGKLSQHQSRNDDENVFHTSPLVMWGGTRRTIRIIRYIALNSTEKGKLARSMPVSLRPFDDKLRQGVVRGVLLLLSMATGQAQVFADARRFKY